MGVRRVHVSLPEELVRRLDEVRDGRARALVIRRAVEEFVKAQQAKGKT